MQGTQVKFFIIKVLPHHYFTANDGVLTQFIISAPSSCKHSVNIAARISITLCLLFLSKKHG